MNLFKALFAASVVACLSVSAFAGHGTLTVGDSAYLPSCGGQIEVTKSAQGNNGEQVNVVFRGVENCSVFDIVGKDGFDFNYKEKKLGGADRSRSGSFTLPKRVIDRGLNDVRIVIRSGTAKHQDTIDLIFVSYQAPRSYPAPAPSTNDPISVPTNGNGSW